MTLRLARAIALSRGLAQETIARRRSMALTALALCAFAGCGKKGPPLPPLHLVPQAVTEIAARRSGDEIRLRFVLPTTNVNGPQPVNLHRVEIIAATVAPGAAVPPNSDFLTPRFVVGRMDVRPLPEEGAPDTPATPDSRPAPGDTVTFTERIDESLLKPQFTAIAPAPAQAPAATADAAAAAPAAAAVPPPLMRVYVIRGVARNGRPGQPSARIQVPLVDPPPPPADVSSKFTATALQLSWTPPATSEQTKPAAFNVYPAGSDTPLNPAPLTTPAFERAGVEFGKEECFVVRTVAQYEGAVVESAPSAPACVTPTDVFPPADPKGLTAVATTGAINLIWEANTDADLGGYLVLRGEAPGDKLQAITASPIQETTYRDTTVTPGVRYVYAIVAVDRATPPNVSGQSPRVEETAR